MIVIEPGNIARCYKTGGQCFTPWMDNVQIDDKHTEKTTQVVLKAMKWNMLQWQSHSSDFNPVEQYISY